MERLVGDGGGPVDGALGEHAHGQPDAGQQRQHHEREPHGEPRAERHPVVVVSHGGEAVADAPDGLDVRRVGRVRARSWPAAG